MNDRQWCTITPTIRVPLSEISFSFSRSSGRGGQHVNKVNTKVTLRFDIAGSTALTEEQKQLVRQRLAGRINRQGVLLLHADRHRSQGANRDEVLERFATLLRQALHRNRARRRTRPGRGAEERRLRAKRRRSRLKAMRRRTDYEPD